MNPTPRLLLRYGVPPLLLLVLLLLAGGRLARQADRARSMQDVLTRAQAVAAPLLANTDRAGPAGAPPAGDPEAGPAGRIEAAAEAAGMGPEQLATIERVGGDDAQGSVRVELRGVSVRALVTFLDAWAPAGSGRGATAINLNPFGEADGELWTAQMRLRD